jgi:hypothetical protein
MRKAVMVLILASIALTATLVLVSTGLGYAQVIIENAARALNQGNHMNLDWNGATHMNAMRHTFGSIPDECQDMHDQLNITDHRMSMP